MPTAGPFTAAMTGFKALENTQRHLAAASRTWGSL